MKQFEKKYNRNKLNVRQKKYIEGLVEGKRQDVAAYEAGYASKQAANNSTRKPYARQFMAKCLEKAGCTRMYLARKIKAGTEATKIINITEKEKVELPDYHVQHKYIVTSLELMDAFPAMHGQEAGRQVVPPINVNIEFVSAEPKAIDITPNEAGQARGY